MKLQSVAIPSLILSLAALCMSISLTLAEDQRRFGQLDQETVTLETLHAMPLAFTENMGQWPDSILYRSNGGGVTMWFTRNGVWYQFFRRVQKANASATATAIGPATMPFDAMPGKFDHERDSIETTIIKAEFVGANKSVEVVGLEELDYKCNYFIGNDSSRWATDVPNYAAIEMRGLYPGVTMRFSGEGGRIRQEVTAKSEAALSRMTVAYHGSEVITEQADGRTAVETGFGQVLFEGVLPVVSEADREASRLSVAAAAPGTVSLIYSTYLGGGGREFSYDIAVDDEGSAYVTGPTNSSDFPTANPYDGSFNGGDYDIFVTKLSADGASLVYSTYLGGSGTEWGAVPDGAIAVDTAGCAYVTGCTKSSDFPTANPYDASFNGGTDAFVTKLSASGNSLVYSTYLGGSGNDYGWGIAVDTAGCAYVTGFTGSGDFPTINAYDASLNYGDVFVTKFSAGGNTLVYSTYLGGTNLDPYGEPSDEYGLAVAVDGSGSAYVTGYTCSHDFPTANPYDASFNGDIWDYDVFVSKLSDSGNSLVYSTYLGVSYRYYGYGIAVDEAGCAYVTGSTSALDFPTANPYDASYNGSSDVFVTKLSPEGNNLIYSTYLGGSGHERSYGIAVDGFGSAYVTGSVTSPDFPTANPYDASWDGSTDDAFVTKLSPSGNGLVYSTYLGGSYSDHGRGIAVDEAGCAYVTGSTSALDFPTANPYDASFNGNRDAFVAKLSAYCCLGSSGNVDCDPLDKTDISDLTALVDNLYISLAPLCCAEEANVNGSIDGKADISDLTRLVDYLYITFTLPAACQ